MIRLSLLLCAAILALLVACGSDPTATSEPATMPPAEAPTAAPGADQGAASPTATAPARLSAADIPPCDGRRGGSVGDCAPEFKGTQEWINSEPLTMDGLQGQVVLIDFWTYTCVNCIRTFPYLRDWHEKYGDLGLNIVGVHTPEFEFEKVRENVEQAIEDFDIGWRVVQDNDFLTWQAYNNRFWPAKYLIDKDGIIQYRHFGEGEYVVTEALIRDLLLDAGVNLAGIPANTQEGPQFDERAFTSGIDGNQTRELYAGLNPQFYSRQPYILQSELYDNPGGGPVVFELPEHLTNNFLYFHGTWTPTLEHMRHSRMTENLEDFVALLYNGTSVNVVLEAEGEPYRVYVTQDQAPVPEADWGRDIQADEEGNTYVLVEKDRMYRLIESPEYSGHELRLSSNSEDFILFAFTFGSYPTGP